MPPPPQVAQELFGARLPQVKIYAELLLGPGTERGLIGPAEAERIWDRHLVNCGAIAELIPLEQPGAAHGGEAPVELADIGSGAGLPGIVLAIMLPQIRVTLVEPMARRTTFLLECAAELGLDNVQVRRGRAEELAGEIRADVVTARAVASLDRLAVLAAGLARPGGLVLAIKGAAAGEELDRALPVLRRLGATDAEVVAAGARLLDRPVTVVRFRTGQSSGPGRNRRPSGARNRDARHG